MDTKELRNELHSFFDKLKALEERARKLANKNLADIAASAHGKIKQLLDHPDTELLADTRKDQSANPDGTLRTDRPAFLVDSITGKSLYENERGPGGDWTALTQAERDGYYARARTLQAERDARGGARQAPTSMQFDPNTNTQR